MFGIELDPSLMQREDYAVLPRNWEPLQAFLASQTQWRYAPTGHPTGLDYAGVKAAVKALGLSFAKVFDGVRVLEDEVLGALSER